MYAVHTWHNKSPLPVAHCLLYILHPVFKVICGHQINAAKTSPSNNRWKIQLQHFLILDFLLLLSDSGGRLVVRSITTCRVCLQTCTDTQERLLLWAFVFPWSSVTRTLFTLSPFFSSSWLWAQDMRGNTAIRFVLLHFSVWRVDK